MSLINNILNKKIKEDLSFEKYFNIDDIFYNNKNYLNFTKKIEKIEIENITTINRYKTIQVNISNKLYDLVGNMYLYIEFTDIDKEYNIIDLIETIELYIGDNIIEKIDPYILNLYFNIYKNQNNKKIYDIISTIDSNSKCIYIPIMFYFMLNNKNLIPLYLLYFDEISLYIKFNNTLKNLRIKENNIYLLVNYIKYDNNYINTIKYQNDVELLNMTTSNKFNFQKMELLKIDDLECRIDGIGHSNIFNININKFITHIILNLENVLVDTIEFKIDRTSLKYTTKELEFLTFLNTDFNLNSRSQLYLINFGIFKEKLSGLVNFNLINNLTLEIKTINTENTNLIFSQFNNNNFRIVRQNSDPIVSPNMIKLSRNIVYTIINTNIEVDIIIVTDEENNNSLYEEFNDVGKTFILRENTPKLYFKDRNNNNIKSISIEVALLNQGDFKSFVGKFKLYTIEYKSYDIYNGKLLGIGEKKNNYLIMELKNLLEFINNKKLAQQNYDLFMNLKNTYKSLLINTIIIETLLEEIINNNTEEKRTMVIKNLKILIDKLENIKINKKTNKINKEL